MQHHNIGGSRITSIDALRGVTLLGILVVHAAVLFSYINKNNSLTFISDIGNNVGNTILAIFQYRCNTIFGILFGVSFYLILRNPKYTSLKFVWRCVLLVCIGLLNKLFYTNDALMWYGIWGCVLVLFRNFSNKALFISFIFFLVASSMCSFFDFRHLIFGERNWSIRYIQDATITSIASYPIKSAILDYVYLLSNKLFDSLWKFLLGYYLARAGYIDEIEKYARKKGLIITIISGYVLLTSLDRYCVQILRNDILCTVYYLYGALSYAISFLFLYYRFYPRLGFFEYYGKLGLTNYSTQGILGICLASTIFIPYKWDLHYVIIASFILYFLQSLFSYYWLQYFKNGPMEYIWRSLTNLKFSNPLK